MVKEGKTPFRHGIGIHTGLVLAGNTVNLASRIEQLTKALRCDILVSEETAKRLAHSFQMKAENPQTVKGYSKPVTAYMISP